MKGPEKPTPRIVPGIAGATKVNPMRGRIPVIWPGVLIKELLEPVGEPVSHYPPVKPARGWLIPSAFCGWLAIGAPEQRDGL